jgi:adenosine deaminase
LDNHLFNRIKRIPKTELHLHLEAGIRQETLLSFLKIRGKNAVPGNRDWRSNDFRYTDLPQFVAAMSTVMDVCIQAPEDYHRIARELFTDLSDQNVRYAEVSFDLARGVRLGIPFNEILSAIDSARRTVAASHPIRIGLIIALNRHLDIKTVNRIARFTADSKGLGVAGMDLHGDESLNTPSEYAEAFGIAADAGLGLRAHAGETQGAERIWETINFLGVSRIGHGIRSIEDEKLIDFLINRKITLEICPTSNCKLNVVASLSEHPIRTFYDLGVPVTVNSDDPFFFNTTITNEYYVLAETLGFTFAELKKITLNAVAAAFLEEEEKKVLQQKIESEFDIY